MGGIARHFVNLTLVLGMTVATPAFAATPPGAAAPAGRAYLGVMVEEVSPEKASALHLAGGTAIANVDQDGPACRAGLKGGDIVTGFNGKPVSGPEQFASLIQGSNPGSTVTLTVWRGGHSQEMKVKLGDWKQMAILPPSPPLPPVSQVGRTMPLPPMAMPPFDVHGYAPMMARSGILVEPLSTQLSEFFGVAPNEGVLVRSVDRGSPGAAAGLKAGDVVVKVNNETIHDMQDWKRALKPQGGKLSLSIVRDKRPQTLQMTVPESTSQLQPDTWNSFDLDMQAMDAEMQTLGPELDRETQELTTLAQLDPQQMDEIHRQAQSAAALTPEMEKQARELSRQAEQMRKQAEKAGRSVTPEMKKQAEEMRKQAVIMRKQSEEMRKELEKMTPELQRQAREMADSMKPAAREWAATARDFEQQWKQMQPEMQKQMEEFKKEWEQEKREWQDILKGSNPKQL